MNKTSGAVIEDDDRDRGVAQSKLSQKKKKKREKADDTESNANSSGRDMESRRMIHCNATCVLEQISKGDGSMYCDSDGDVDNAERNMHGISHKRTVDKLSERRIHPDDGNSTLIGEKTMKTIMIPRNLTSKDAKKIRKVERRKARSEGIAEDQIIFVIEGHSQKKGGESEKNHVVDQERSHMRHRPAFAFSVDDTDHCETPAAAYSDLLCLLDACCHILGKTRRRLRIYDPFYCDGAVIRHLGNAGFVDVYNRCEDFYKVQAAGKVPSYEVIVTNPPYSGEHIEKLLAFCASSGKPWFCLLPNWVYTKSYYSQHVHAVWYLVRHTVRYAYEPPRWVEACKGSTSIEKGRVSTAPFPSFWYCWFPIGHERDQALEEVDHSVAMAASTPFIVRDRRFEIMMRYPLLLCLNEDMLPYEVRGELDNTRKRPNAKARKRMKKRMTTDK